MCVKVADARARLLGALEELVRLPGADLMLTLTKASDVLARALDADKVDTFLLDPARASLVAVGSSLQPLSQMQRALGLDVLPIANGGRVVWVYETGKTFLTGRLREDREELRGIKESLKIESK